MKEVTHIAKLNAPCLSFGASGKLANALVFFGWKGLNVVRQYVIPANPNTTAQQGQRGHLTDAVEAIHLSEQSASDPLNDTDRSAFSQLGSLQATPRTWFNTMVKLIVDQLVDALYWCIFSGGAVTPASTQLTLQLGITASVGPEPTTGKIHYGVSKSNLSSSIVCTVADLLTGKAVTGLTNGTKYYLQYRPTSGVEYVGSNSGIYHGTPSA